MKDEKNNISYSAGEIVQYLKGELSAGERHAMEKAAMDDPFLAEAMEGYEGMENKEWQTQLDSVRQKIADGEKSVKIITLRRPALKWWRAAAAILVLGGGTTLAVWLSTEKTKDNLPQIARVNPGFQVNPPEPKPSSLFATDSNVKDEFAVMNRQKSKVSPELMHDSVTTIYPTVADSSFIFKPGNTSQADMVKQDKPNKVAILEQNNANVPVVNNKPTGVLNNAGNANESVATNGSVVQTNVSLEENAKKRAEQKSAFLKRSAALNHNFGAQVVGPDNTPLPFANINIKDENFGTYADVKGMVRLVSTDSLVNIEVRSVGYTPRNYILHSNRVQDKIVLSEDENAIKSITNVKGKDLARNKQASRRATVIKDSVANVEPADGWDNYGTYVNNNFDIPEEVLKKESHGEVELIFDVKSDGRITNIKVGQSNCDDCAEAAKKLISQGPQWKVKKGKKASARIKMQF